MGGEEPRTVAFLFTDLEGSTRLWERHPTAMRDALAAHDQEIQQAFENNGGSVVKHTGDGALAAFDDAAGAVLAALDAQRGLDANPSDELGPLRARMGIHVAVVGDIEHGCYEVDGDYLGPALHRCARLMAIAHGGQVVLSGTAADSVDLDHSHGVVLENLGRHRLRDLADRELVFQVVHPDLWLDFPPLRSVDAYPGNLPKQLTSFVGRDAELDELSTLVDDTRLVTLTGVGGVGKTRLAVHTAAQLVDRYEDGAWLVDLTPISDPELVPATVASTLRIREKRGETITDTICEYLADRSLVLVVDNCEHVIDAAAVLIDELHSAVPGLRCIATSREALRLAGEQTWRVPVLGLPDDGMVTSDAATTCESVQLFVDRARSSDNAFELDDGNVDAVVDLCRRLDGIPLAIELAAVRSAVMAPEEMLHRLDARFALLTEGVRSEVVHHQTLRAAIDWSHDLLELPEQEVFRRLSVFTGGWTLAAAEEVTSGSGVDRHSVLDLLSGLVRKSMVVFARGDGATRYRLLESLREYGRDHLAEAGEAAEYGERHARHFFEFVTGLDTDLRGPGQADAYDLLTAELDNVRSAFDWFVANGDGDEALRMMRVLRTYMAELRPGEGFQRALDAVSVADEASPGVLASGLADAAWMGYVGEREEAGELAHRSIAVSEEAGLPPDPEAVLPLGLVALYEGDLEASLAHFERGAQVAREIDDIYEIAACQTGVCFLRSMLGHADAAIEAGEEATRLGRELRYDTQISGGLAALGFAYGAVDVERSVALLDESLEIKDDTTYSAVARVLVAHLKVLLGQLPEALQHFCSVLEVHRTFGDTYFVPMSLEGMASVFAIHGRAEFAARVLGASESARKKLDLPGLDIEMALLEGAVAMVEGALEADEFQAEMTVGRGWTLDESIGAALAEAADLLPFIDLREEPDAVLSAPEAAE